MKSCIIIIALYLVVVGNARTAEQKAQRLEYQRLCQDENDRTRNAAETGMGYYSANGLGCVTACIWKKMGIMNTDGTFNNDVARSVLPDLLNINNVENFMATCMNHTAANDCQTGFQLLKCYIENKTSLGLP